MALSERVLLKLSKEMLGQVDELAGAGRRSDFIRTAIEERVARESVAEAPKSAVVEKSAQAKKDRAPAHGLRADDSLVLEQLGRKRGTARMVAKEMGWEELRVAKSGERLQSAGLVRFDRGVMEAV